MLFLSVFQGKALYLLDETRKKWYDKNMKTEQEINKKIAGNLVRYRKEAGLTQAELAEKINYSDKSVSKWESGNGIPDVYTLLQIAEIYGVSLQALIDGEESISKVPTKRWRLCIILLSSGLVWLVATCIFVLLKLVSPTSAAWLAFIYAVAVNAIVMIVFASVWKYRIVNFLSVSTLVWMALTCLFLTFRIIFENATGLWLLYLLGIPLQILEILWVFFRSLFKKNKKAAEVIDKDTQEEENEIAQVEE